MRQTGSSISTLERGQNHSGGTCERKGRGRGGGGGGTRSEHAAVQCACACSAHVHMQSRTGGARRLHGYTMAGYNLHALAAACRCRTERVGRHSAACHRCRRSGSGRLWPGLTHAALGESRLLVEQRLLGGEGGGGEALGGGVGCPRASHPYQCHVHAMCMLHMHAVHMLHACHYVHTPQTAWGAHGAPAC